MTRSLAWPAVFALGLIAGGAFMVQAQLAGTGRPFLRTWADARDVPVHLLAEGKARAQVLLHRDTGLASAAMSRLEADPGWVLPRHRHERSDELIYILDGGGLLSIGGRNVEVFEGMALWIPRGQSHGFRAGPLGVKAIQVYAPGGPERRFLKAPLRKGEGPRAR